MERFTTRLDNVIIGNQKLMVNLLRFQRSPYPLPHHRSHQKPHNHSSTLRTHPPESPSAKTQVPRITLLLVPMPHHLRTRPKPGPRTKPPFYHLHFEVQESEVQKFSVYWSGRKTTHGLQHSRGVYTTRLLLCERNICRVQLGSQMCAPRAREV